MKVCILGATGNAGQRLVEEALRRGHVVTAAARHLSKVKPRPRLTVKTADVGKPKTLIPAFKDQEAVISTFIPKRGSANFREACLSGYRAIIDTAKKVGLPRLLVVGGAGSLEVSPGVQLLDSLNFPKEYRTEAETHREVLGMLRKERELDWTYISPAIQFVPGERTGAYRLGGDQLLTDTAGGSRISMEDYAVAVLDEVEKAQNRRRRISVAY